MVDDVGTAPPEAGYEQDFHAWTQAQAQALRMAARVGTNVAVDWENVAEEVESLGRSQATALRSRMRTIIEHLMKLEFSPAGNPAAGWRDAVTRCRIEFEDEIADSPSLRRRIPDWLEREHASALRLATLNLRQHGEWTPDRDAALRSRRYSAEEVLGDWLPAMPPSPGG